VLSPTDRFHLLGSQRVAQVSFSQLLHNCQIPGQARSSNSAAMDARATRTLLQFQPLSSGAVDAEFWHTLHRQKLQVQQLSEEAIQLVASIQPTVRNALPATLHVEAASLMGACDMEEGRMKVPGLLVNFNTASKFASKAAREEAFRNVVDLIWEDVQSGAAIRDPSKLSRFLLVTFADLKSFQFHYWFAFPALKPPENFMATKPIPFQQLHSINPKLIDSCRKHTSEMAWALHISEESEVIDGTLSDFSSLQEKFGQVYVAFADPSLDENAAGWTLRNLLILLQRWWVQRRVKLISVRYCHGRPDLNSSLVLEVDLPDFPSTFYAEQAPRAVGWEKNRAGKLLPRRVDLSSSMDPAKLASAAVDLNLQLMKWRAAPGLDIERVAGLNCLILGAGTLGCTVARGLVAWGVRNVTFVDSGRVSYSNPARQSLYTFQDCLEGGRPKAESAAAHLKEVFPGVLAMGIEMTIPMPGHLIIEEELGATVDSINRLDKLVEASDVVFLLTDTRESRWLPTLLATAHNKITLNSALGFDSFLVMRHGQKPSHTSKERLGCYFCNDVIAPVNSTVDRTLDQQCTVTRPGLASVAGALAVELMVSIVSHPEGIGAPAHTSSGGTMSVMSRTDSPSPLGVVPHSIRGSFHNYVQQSLTGFAFPSCTACSSTVVEEYESFGVEFVMTALQNPASLEELTGLAKVHAMAEAASVEWDVDTSDPDE